jgi:hypothetical protein
MNCSKCTIALNELNTEARYTTCKPCRKLYKDIWRLNNQDKIKQYSDNRLKYTCHCGATLRDTPDDRRRHERTKKHTKIRA